MHIDMLGVAGAGVALVLPGVLLRSEARVDIIIDIIIDIVTTTRYNIMIFILLIIK